MPGICISTNADVSDGRWTLIERQKPGIQGDAGLCCTAMP